MSLSAPTVGDVIDRLTILSLKILYGKQANRETTHWQQERIALLAKLRWCDSRMLDLAAVNAALWQAEDALRDLRPKEQPRPPWDPVAEAQTLAFRIQALNDQRKELIAAIDKETRTP